MLTAQDLVISLSSCTQEDEKYTGRQATILAELLANKFPVLLGFVVTPFSYLLFFQENRLETKIKHLLGTVNFDRVESLSQVSRHIQELIQNSPLPKEFVKNVFEEYKKVGITSKLTIEGRFITGEAVLLEKIRELWAEEFSAKNIYDRHAQDILGIGDGKPLLVQKALEKGIQGVIYTESMHDKKMLQVNVVDTQVWIDRETGLLSEKLSKKRIFSEKEYKELGKLGMDVEKHFYFPKQVIFNVEKGKPYIIDVKLPVQNSHTPLQDLDSQGAYLSPIVVGDPISPGVGIGKVLIKPKARDTKSGVVYVSDIFDKKETAIIKKASAALFSHVSKEERLLLQELGIPVIANIPQLLIKVTDGLVVSVNGRTGEVLPGSMLVEKETTKSFSKTATKVYLQVCDLEKADSLSNLEIDGIGILHANPLVRRLGKHPNKMIEEGTEKVLSQHLATEIGKYAKAIFPRPMFYQVTDFKTHEYKNLAHGKHFEMEEENPALGFRGALRHIHNPKVFDVELQAVLQARDTMECSNVGIVVPFVRTVQEFENIKKLIHTAGLVRSHTCKVYMKIETPLNAILVKDFISSGVDGFIIDSDSLTSLIIGMDLQNPELAPFFDVGSAASLWAYERIISACRDHNVPVFVSGQVVTTPDVLEKIIKYGVNGVITTVDRVHEVNAEISNLEEGLVRKLRTK